MSTELIYCTRAVIFTSMAPWYILQRNLSSLRSRFLVWMHLISYGFMKLKQFNLFIPSWLCLQKKIFPHSWTHNLIESLPNRRLYNCDHKLKTSVKGFSDIRVHTGVWGIRALNKKKFCSAYVSSIKKNAFILVFELNRLFTYVFLFAVVL